MATPDASISTPERIAPPETEHPRFSYEEAFSRNIGWVTRQEQSVLRSSCVAIAGLGGVGGSHLLTLLRLGVGRFHLADFDVYELANFNRQAGASLPEVGRAKVEVMREQALRINPTVTVTSFPAGVQRSNVQEFLSGVDLYVDSLDFFAIEARRMVFAECWRRNIPAITAAPLGMGGALLCFVPGKGMSFDEYFDLQAQPRQEQLLRFLVGLAPAGLHRGYLVDPSTVNLQEQRGPSTAMACELCAGLAVSQALKLLLKRGRVLAAPHALQFDAYRNRLAHTRRRWGNRHPLQRLTLAVARRQFLRKPVTPAPTSITIDSPILRVLDLARWAPSGDNTQPWRFEIIGERGVIVHGRDTRQDCVYDLDGRSSHLAHGILLETLRLAATTEGWRTDVNRLNDAPDFRVDFAPCSKVRPHPLAKCITTRVTQRRAMTTRAVPASARGAMAYAAGADFELHWRTSNVDRARLALLMAKNAGIRLTIPEAYRTHLEAIQWRSRFSEDRLPDEAIGLDPVGTALMRWAMRSWDRVSFMNRYLAGTLLPRLQLDLLPGLRCGGFVLLTAREPARELDDYVAAGGAVQRLWLAATEAGLLLQPQMTPLIFARYLRQGIAFTRQRRAVERARDLAGGLVTMFGADAAQRAVFLARVGRGPNPVSRSLRLPMDRLLVSNPRAA